MARFKENDLPKSKITASSLNKATLIFRYAGNHRWKFYVGLVFLLFTGATALAFPKLMGMLIDCVKDKSYDQANAIALLLIGILSLQSVFFLLQIVFICQFYRTYFSESSPFIIQQFS